MEVEKKQYGGLRPEVELRLSADVRICYSEVNNLVGRLLTLADATFTDHAQRKAQKDMIRANVYGWLDDQYDNQYEDYEHIGGIPSEETIKLG